MRNKQKWGKLCGFTLIELMVVIAVLAILAGITVVGYGKWRESIAQKEVQSDLQMVAAAMESAKNFGSGYPGSVPSTFKGSPNVSLLYSMGNSSSYCIKGFSNIYPSINYYVSKNSGLKPLPGECTDENGGDPGGGGNGTIANGDSIQTVTRSNCPGSRTMVVDARDNHTYWIQKLADEGCWMLTNLAYAGGGNNSNGDVISITPPANYRIPPGSNVTSYPTPPSTSTNGAGQYGYLYNYCAAMGVQLSTRICDAYSTQQPDVSISICPSGWRLPARNGYYTSDFTDLNTAINSGSGTNSSGFRATWLGQYSGNYSDNYGPNNNSGFINQGTAGIYWVRLDAYWSGAAFTFHNNYVNTYFTPASELTHSAIRCVTST